MLDAAFQKLWYGRSPLTPLLLPISFLFLAATAVRRFFYRRGLIRSYRVSRPVIVVGNLTVGGTGKTPFVVWLANELRARGHVPGVITRGYGGTATSWPCDVEVASNPAQVGDEAVMLAVQTGGIVVAGPNRVSAARRAIERGATLVISDDGLQHYRLVRDVEIAIVDGERLFGNGWLLPAGPMREPVSRLAAVDGVVVNYRNETGSRKTAADRFLSEQALSDRVRQTSMQTRLGRARSLTTNEVRNLGSFSGQLVHAVAGIGNPQSFFDSLREAGLSIDAHPLDDHAALSPQSVRFPDSAAVLMTEKDAIKCRSFADERLWAVTLDVEVDRASEWLTAITQKILLRN